MSQTTVRSNGSNGHVETSNRVPSVSKGKAPRSYAELRQLAMAGTGSTSIRTGEKVSLSLPTILPDHKPATVVDAVSKLPRLNVTGPKSDLPGESTLKESFAASGEAVAGYLACQFGIDDVE